MSSLGLREATRYVAIRNGTRVEDIQSFLDSRPAETEIVAAFDRDTAGEAYTAFVRKIVEQGDRELRVESPTEPFNDWNEELLARKAEAARPATPRPRAPGRF